jgi:hypothetical protein
MIVYYTKAGKFQTDDIDSVNFSELNSPDEFTPAFYNHKTEEAIWYKDGLIHRETGPAKSKEGISYDNDCFYLNGKCYSFNEFLINHPNQDWAFKYEMVNRYDEYGNIAKLICNPNYYFPSQTQEKKKKEFFWDLFKI